MAVPSLRRVIYNLSVLHATKETTDALSLLHAGREFVSLIQHRLDVFNEALLRDQNAHIFKICPYRSIVP